MQDAGGAGQDDRHWSAVDIEMDLRFPKHVADTEPLRGNGRAPRPGSRGGEQLGELPAPHRDPAIRKDRGIDADALQRGDQRPCELPDPGPGTLVIEHTSVDADRFGPRERRS